VRALILAAGLGTRLRPLTYVRAKAAVPVNGEPLIRRVISWLVAQGFSDLMVNLHHQPASVGAAVGDGQDLGARVRYSWEDPVLGSAGGPRHALPMLVEGLSAGEQQFLLVNGDTLTDLALAALVDAHHASGALVTMAVIPNPRPERYGGVLVESGRVTGFGRPGRLSAGAQSFHFIGVQVADARVFADLPDGEPAESVLDLYPQLMSRDRTAIRAFPATAVFRDIGTPADYLQTSLELATAEGDRLIAPGSSGIHPSADVRRTAVWDNVTIGAHSRLHECIVCDGAAIPPGSHYRRCAIAPYRGEGLHTGERLEGSLIIREL
jgi:mannose-1-phosphate guanylyltransferase